MKSLKVFLVARTLAEASARLRLAQHVPGLAERGMDARLMEIPARGGARRFSFIRSFKEADAIVLHRKLFNAIEFAFVRRNSRFLIFDFDDAVMFRDSFSKKRASRRRARRFARTASGCDAAIAGCAVLADAASAAGARRVETVPTPVDPSKYGATEVDGGREGFVAGWIGQASTLGYLEDAMPALEMASRSIKGFRLRVISDRFPESDAFEIEKIPWSEASQAARLSEIDAGLMPLRDDPWSRGKCGYKILQYFASGKPAVASPVGANLDLVIPGRTGFLAADPSQWAGALAALASDPASGREMGARGRSLLTEGGYDLASCTGKLADLLIEAAG